MPSPAPDLQPELHSKHFRVIYSVSSSAVSINLPSFIVASSLIASYKGLATLVLRVLISPTSTQDIHLCVLETLPYSLGMSYT